MWCHVKKYSVTISKRSNKLIIHNFLMVIAAGKRILSMIFNRNIKWLLLALLCGASAGAYAHKVNVFAYVEGDQIYVEGYFSDGTRAKNSEVTVYEGDGRELTKGLTNEEGDFIFPIKDKEALRIVLNAGQGHQAIYEIPTDEISGTPVSQLSDQSTPHSANQDWLSRLEVLGKVIPPFCLKQWCERRSRRGCFLWLGKFRN